MTSETVAIMQPTYLPWIGYFDMIDQVDTFVFLDSVQFSPRSWQQRNRIKSPDGEMWLTVPVSSRGDLDKTIRETPIAKQADFPDHHLKTLHHFYTNSPYFDDYFDGLSRIIEGDYDYLGPLNIDLTEWLCEALGIETRFERSSALKVGGGKVARLLEICEELSADRYLSAEGSKEYIEEDNQFNRSWVDVSYHQYSHPSYDQRFGQFISHLSVVDLLFNEGGQSLNILRQGRQSSDF